ISSPINTHNPDSIQASSHAFFQVSKYIVTKFISTFLAIPVAYSLGIYFEELSCEHVWFFLPFSVDCLLLLKRVKTISRSVIRTVVAGLCQS
uniref:Caveolin n=1 Tax=Sus scrofa TaxID=9823 RepID=A0A8D1R243_PIG